MKKVLALKSAAALACAVLLQMTGLNGPSVARAQLASFTRTYQDVNALLPVDYNNSNMITAPYYGGSGTNAKGYLLVSNVDNGNGNIAVRLTAVKQDGSQSWSRVYGSFSGTTRCFGIAFDKRDQGYALTGYKTTTSGNDELWVLKVDRDGNPFAEYSLRTDTIPCTKQGGLTQCRIFHSPQFYGMDILQIGNDTTARNQGDFAIVGFVSDKPSVHEYHTYKRNFVWRVGLPTTADSISIGPAFPRTRYLKVFHGQGIGDNQPTDQDLADEIQEIPGIGLLLIGHTKGFNSSSITPVPSPTDGIMYPYYALLPYNGGGSSILPGIFPYAFLTKDNKMNNVRTLYGSDHLVYMLGYYQPSQAFTITPFKPTNGSQATTTRYYTSSTQNVPAFSFQERKSNPDQLVVMGYRLGTDNTVQEDYVHPYDIIVKKAGGAASNFNVERIKSDNYRGYAPADPTSGVDFFKPFDKFFPPVTLPNIGLLNLHLGNEDADVAGVLHRQLSGSSQERYHATLSQFKAITGSAECNPVALRVGSSELPLDYDKISFNVNNISFTTTIYNTTVRNTGKYYKCDEIPPTSTGDTVGIARRIPNNIAENDLKLYPNPTTDVLQIQGLNGTSYSYRITTITGVLVQSGSFEQQTALSVRNYANGVYLIHITAKDGAEHNYRFVKE